MITIGPPGLSMLLKEEDEGLSGLVQRYTYNSLAFLANQAIAYVEGFGVYGVIPDKVRLAPLIPLVLPFEIYDKYKAHYDNKINS